MSKRQLTLGEAFKVPLSPPAPAAKRPRLSSPPLASSSSSAAPLSTTTPSSASTFSLSSYRESLSTKGSEPTEADLLKLECDTLDPSWLALLKDEIKKPYFRELKKFLWKEGLRGLKAKDEKGKLTVLPPGDCEEFSLSSLGW